jgi:rhamnogalacturonan endolyase
MIMPGVAYETSSGGPFMRDINSQSGDDQELYWYMNSGHVRTEPWRFGLMGPYAMKFTYALISFLIPVLVSSSA